MNTTQKIIGITGSFAGGKDTLAKHLEDNFGFIHVSTGDLVRKQAMELKGSIERPVLHEVGNMLRQKHGAGYFVELALQELRRHPDAPGMLVSGIRSLGEAKVIKQHNGLLAFVDADAKIRYNRMKSRQRDAETALSFEQFIANEADEWYGGPTDADFNLTGIKQIADVQLDNSADLQSFLQAGESALDL